MAVKKAEILAFAVILLSLAAFTACTQNNGSKGTAGVPETTQNEAGSFAQHSEESPETTANEPENITEFPTEAKTTEPPETTQPTTEPPKPVEVESIVLKADSTQIVKGAVIELTVVVSPDDADDKTYTLTSGDENVLKKTDDGWVAVGGGTAELTATSANGVTGKISVTVIVPVESISAGFSEKAMYRGDSLTLNLTILPADATNRAITYITDNPNVAAVSDTGVIYAAGGGTATVTCAASNGVWTSCKITVIVPVTSIYIETDKYTYKTGETVGFKVTVYPGDATDKSYSIDISGPGGKLTGNNSLTCASGGLKTITVFASNGVSGKTEIEVIDLNELAAEVIRLTNIERANRGLSELSGSNSSLHSAAMIRAGEIVGTFSHTRPDGSRCFTVLDDVGLDYRAAGENICSGFSSPEAAVDGWMNSQGHRDNILDPEYTHMGAGVEMDGDGRFHWVQIFMFTG